MRGASDTLDENQELDGSAPRRSPWLRLGVLFAIVVTLLVVGRALGLHEKITVESVRAWVEDAGLYGILLFIALFVVGQMLYLPNLLFVIAAALAYGAGLGAAVSLSAAIVAVSVNFVFVRAVGGQPLGAVKNRWLVAARRHLDARPRLTLIGLRVLFFTSPPLTAVVALSPVRFRDHLAASFIGMTPQALMVSFLVDWFV